MKLGFIERFIINNPIRAAIQRRVEGPMLRKMGSLERYQLCLEIGCGTGIGVRVIVERFGSERVVATDIDPQQIERAKKTLGPEFEDAIEFKVADAMELDEPDGKFDAVFSFGVIHHLEDWRKGIREVSRVLRSGGEFFFSKNRSVCSQGTSLLKYSPLIQEEESSILLSSSRNWTAIILI